jgi:hypothetical protein
VIEAARVPAELEPPSGAVPVLDQRPVVAVVTEEPDRPRTARRRHGDGREVAGTGRADRRYPCSAHAGGRRGGARTGHSHPGRHDQRDRKPEEASKAVHVHHQHSYAGIITQASPASPRHRAPESVPHLPGYRRPAPVAIRKSIKTSQPNNASRKRCPGHTRNPEPGPCQQRTGVQSGGPTLRHRQRRGAIPVITGRSALTRTLKPTGSIDIPIRRFARTRRPPGQPCQSRSVIVTTGRRWLPPATR